MFWVSVCFEDIFLSKGLDVIESTNLKYFNKEMIAEFFSLKGTYLAKIGR